MTGITGIIDLGSHSVRLVLYQHVLGHPVPVYNEKATCTLGRTLADTGLLDETGKELAWQAMRRFTGIARAWEVTSLTVLATAAIRSAGDGAAFARALEEAFNITITIISGEQETLYSAQGLFSCLPEAGGLFGDMGGSSLELALLDNRNIQPLGTLPLGILSLEQRSTRELEDALKTLLPDNYLPRETFYAIGGSWRALARYWQTVNQYPLKTPHLFVLGGKTLTDFLEDVTDKKKLPRKIAGVSRDRLSLLPNAARMLKVVQSVFGIREVAFSACGLREGYIWRQNLPVSRDAIAIQEAIAFSTLRCFANPHWKILHDWLSPLFPAMIPLQARVLATACVLTDIAATEGEGKNQKATMTLDRLLSAPLYCLLHSEKALLSALLYASYAGDLDGREVTPLLTMLEDSSRAFALKAGIALRLARTVCASRYDLLAEVPMEITGTVSLRWQESHFLFPSETVERRLEALQQVAA